VYPRITDFIREHREAPSKPKKGVVQEALGSD
jgi:hypothetical protein